MPKTRELWANDETAAFLLACYDLEVRIRPLVPTGQVWAVPRPRPIQDLQLPAFQGFPPPVSPFVVQPGGVLSPLS